MKLQIEIPDGVVEKVIRGIMENFPEASNGCALRCIGWQYETMSFDFYDDEETKRYNITNATLLATFPLIFTDKWPKGCAPPLASNKWEQWEEWLCRCDATDFDAFAQLACLGEVIYG
jgi:hypothetical protein